MDSSWLRVRIVENKRSKKVEHPVWLCKNNDDGMQINISAGASCLAVNTVYDSLETINH